MRQAYLNQGAREDSVDTLLASLSSSTYKQYNTSYKKWFGFCNSNNINPTSPTVSSLLSFLQFCFNEGVGYSSLGTHRSAISLITPNSLEKLGDNPLIVRFLRGVGKIRPACPKYDSTWDPAPVLAYLGSLEPLEELSLESLTLKLLGLLTLATGQRLQTLHAIDVLNIDHSNEDFLQIKIEKQIKTTRPGALQPCLYLPRFVQHEQWCVVRTLRHYLFRTAQYRYNPSSLFLGISGNHNPVSKQTMTKWVKKIFINSGIDSKIFSSHSTRHASTSAAVRLGVPMDSICSRAGWTPTTSVFAQFYNRPLDTRSNFARAVLLNQTHH